MPIGEIFLAAFIQVLFEKLASIELLKFARREQVHIDLKRWSGELAKIQAFLADAEGKQIENRAVKMWLEELTDLAYDLDDILDEFATEALRSKLTSESQAASASKSKLQAMIPTCCKRLNPTTLLSDFTRNSTSKIEEITTRLKNILESGSVLGLQQIIAGESTKTWYRPPSTSLIHEPRICGRDKEKKEIIDFLLRNESSDRKVGVIPIVGMGGLGKTTLAQMVYNDEVVNKNFDSKAWVCVSDEFDILRISKAILESITSKSCEFKELNQVQVQLKQNLVGKKILIVLDDVWDKKYNDWNVLKSPFNDGAPGSKIIVTTRDRDVALIMGTVQNLLLQHLSDDDCWLVFEQHAFGNRSMDANPNLVFIGRKIVAKCKGLPLAARTLGGLLRCKEGDDDWEIVLNSKIWDLTEQGNEIPPALRLSYHHLPSHLKRCFAYCSILPKDYEFEKEELVFLWMAEGLLQQQNGKKQMEDLGAEYFHELQSRSFFQPSSGGESSKFVMHDLINDLAQSIAGYTCFRLEDKLKDWEQCRKLKSARYSSYMQSEFDTIKKFETFYEAENVRAFLPLSLNKDESCYLTSNVPLNLLPKMKRLRVLSLSRYRIGELIPKSIGYLKHLRYLNFSYTNIKTLPESLGTLYNLQTLMLRGCPELKKLPADMGNLINLHHLDMIDSNSLEEMPRGIGKLTSLQTLSNFIVMKDNGFRIRELGNLIHLRGKLCISGIENVVDPLDVKGVCLNDQQGIDSLTMVWSSESLDGLRNEMVETEVLDILQPHKKLKELYIRGYHGMRFPIWTGDPLFSNMVCMKVQNCKNCTSLPPLGQLPSLKDLHIEGMSAVKHVGCEFYGQHCAKPFPLLETLCFENMSEWEDWYIFGIEKEVQIFTRVSKLSIKKCPKLVGMLPSNLPCLKTLEIINCPQLLVEASSLVLPSFTSLTMSDVRLPSLPVLLETCNVLEPSSLTCLDITNVTIPESLCNPSIVDEVMLANAMSKHLSSVTSLSIKRIQKLALLPQWLTQGLKGLKELQIYSCKELTTLWQNEAGLQHSLLALQSLKINDCPQLVSLFEEDEDVENEGQYQQDGVPSIVRLEYLRIYNCEKLEKLPRGLHTFTSLREMDISGCPRLVSFSETGLPPSLRQLWIYECKALRSLPGWTSHDSNLEFLGIQGCDNLESLPEEWIHHPATKLTTLTIRECEKLELVLLPNPSLRNNNNSLFASLETLMIESWPAGGGIVSSYILEKGNFLTNLTYLEIVNMKIGKPLSEWGLHRFSSLKSLWLEGPSNVAEEEEEYYSVSSFPVDGMLLPTSLMSLWIYNFPNLEKIFSSSSSMETIRNLTYLNFRNCPRLASFPEQGGLPPSLLALGFFGCPIMKRRCEKGKGQYWPLIAPIPAVFIDGRYIFEVEEAHIWRLQNFVLGEHILKPCPENPTPIKACAISACGNFSVLGTAGGWIERFNLQSGISRGSYVDMSEGNSCAHDVEVVAVACDSTNTLMISAGYHGDIKVWDFKGRELKSRWKIGCSLVKIVYHRSNGLLAMVADDLVICLFDVVALRMVHKFEGHTDRITDLCFSEDGKWLLSSSMDRSLRIWDVILARQIDAILVDVCITALSLSPNMDVLATTHVDQNGVYLWVNQAMFTGASNDESYGSGKEIVSVKFPSVSSIEGSQDNDSDRPIITPSKVAHKSSDQQIPDLVTLSLLPKSQWQSLINLDIIKARNKPIEPPKKSEQAPFFLPPIPSLSGEILFKPIESANEEKDREAGKLKKEQTQIDLVASQFVQLLQSAADTENFLAFTDYIKSLSPSTLDVELRMLQIIDDDDDEQELDKRPEFHSIELLLDYFIHEISCRNNFEFIQALIRLFLKIHGETIRRQPKLQDKAQKLLDIQRAVWQRVDRLFQSARCMVTFLSDSQF